MWSSVDADFCISSAYVWCQEWSGLTDSKTFQPEGGLNRKNTRTNIKFWPLNPYYKKSNWKTCLSKRFSEAVSPKLWHKKIHAAEAYRNGEKLKYYVHPGFYLSTFVCYRFLPKIQFLYCLLSKLFPWGAPIFPKWNFLKFMSPDCWKTYFWHSFWLQKYSLYIVCLQQQQFF